MARAKKKASKVKTKVEKVKVEAVAKQEVQKIYNDAETHVEEKKKEATKSTNDLMAQIRQGVTLKPKSKKKPSVPRLGLMDQIKQGTTLKPTKPRKKPKHSGISVSMLAGVKLKKPKARPAVKKPKLAFQNVALKPTKTVVKSGFTLGKVVGGRLRRRRRRRR